MNFNVFIFKIEIKVSVPHGGRNEQKRERMHVELSAWDVRCSINVCWWLWRWQEEAEKEEEKYDKVFGKRKVVAKIPKFRLDARSKVKAQSDFKF